MTSVCFSGSCKTIHYTIIEEGEHGINAFKADVYIEFEEPTTAMFRSYDTALIWIKRIINERCKDADEVGRYN